MERKKKQHTFPIEIFPRRIRVAVCSTFILWVCVFFPRCSGEMRPFFIFTPFETTQFQNADSIRKEKLPLCVEYGARRWKAESDLLKWLFILRIAPILLNDVRCTMCVQWHFEQSIRLCMDFCFRETEEEKKLHLHIIRNEAWKPVCSSVVVRI